MSMAPHLRKFALTVHVVCSVALLGSIAAFLALSIAGLDSRDPSIIRAAYPAMDIVARYIIVPLAFGSLLSGLVQSFGTPWGLFRHYWVLAKLLLSGFATAVLLMKLEMIGHAARLAAEAILPHAELGIVGTELRLHAAAGLVVLLVTAILSVYKPRGLTPYGRRKQQEQKGPSQGPEATRRRRSPISWGIGVSSGGSVTVTLSRMQILGAVVAIAVLHLLVLHVAGAGHIGH